MVATVPLSEANTFSRHAIKVEDYGAAGNGTTDDTTAFQSALAALYANGGGVLVLGAKTYRINSSITLPNDGAATPRQPPIKLQGAGAFWSGQGGVITGSTVLDMRGTQAEGKLITLGLGRLEIDGITFTTGPVTDSKPFLYTTNTTLHVHGNAFIGSADRDQVTCDQDAIVCGGTSITLGGGLNAPFQGYGTIVERNYFNRIRRWVYGRVYFNGNVIQHNTGWTKCGTNLAGGAAIELDASLDVCSGNLIFGNLCEIGGYPYAIKLTQHCNQNTILANGCFDASATTLAAVLIADSTSTFNSVSGSVGPAAKPYLVDLGAATRYVSLSQGEIAKFPPTRFADEGYATEFDWLVASGGPSKTTIQPRAATAGDGSSLFDIKRSDAETTNPGASIAKFLQSGAVELTGAGSGNITTSQAAGMSWSNNGRTWKANGAGGTIEINSGTGGSFNEHKGFSHRFYDHTGAFGMAITGAGVAKWGTNSTTFDVGLTRNAAGVLEVDNGTAGTFRDLRVRNVIQQPPASVTPSTNGDLVVEATSNTSLTFKLKGSDGVVRSGTLTLA